MKSFLKILIFSSIIVILFPDISQSINKKTILKKNNYYEGKIFWNGLPVELPTGKWQMLGRIEWQVSSIVYMGDLLILLEKNTIKGVIELGYVETGGKWIADVNQWIYSTMFKNKNDGCYDRREYYFLKVKRKGGFHNCMVIRHYDVYKETYKPDRTAGTDDSYYTAFNSRWW